MRLREREIKVIQIIKEHPYVTSREIADYLKLSEKTVRSVINSLISDFGVAIKSKRGVGYYLNVEEYNKLESIFKRLLHNVWVKNHISFMRNLIS